MSGAMTGPVNGDRGETLLEILVAVVIMGIGLVAVVGGLATGVVVSDVHRKQSTAGETVRDYAEAVQSSVASGGYVACAGAGSYTSPAGFAAPSGHTASIEVVRYWTGSAWTGSCAADKGLQQLTAAVASTDGRATERLVFVVRKPCRTSDAPC